MGLDDSLVNVVKGGVCANRRRGGEGVAVDVQECGIDTVCGNEAFSRVGKISCRVSQLPASLVPLHDNASHTVMAAQQIMHASGFSLGQQGTNHGRRDALPVGFLDVITDVNTEAIFVT